MIFAYQILSMTNHCNLHCSYCDWEKTGGFTLSEEQLHRACRNLQWTREFADREFGDFLMGVYSGGEPFVYPALVERFLRIYSDKWVRISTNGLFDAGQCLPMLERHGNVILTASLDGMDLESNRARFCRQEQLQKVLQNIYEALCRGLYVMVLCTINRFNIDYFYAFAESLWETFEPYADCGRLVMPAHYITGYTTPAGLPSQAQEQRFLEQMPEALCTNPLLGRADWHYRRLMEYVRTKQHPDCKVDRWSRCAHFLGEQIITDGVMNSYLCAMRGYGDLGQFSSPLSTNHFQALYEKKCRELYGGGKKCHCFVDWTAFDAVLDGTVSPERAGDWFEFFRENSVMEWMTRYKESVK